MASSQYVPLRLRRTQATVPRLGGIAFDIQSFRLICYRQQADTITATLPPIVLQRSATGGHSSIGQELHDKAKGASGQSRRFRDLIKLESGLNLDAQALSLPWILELLSDRH